MTYPEIGQTIGQLVEKKNKAYGDSHSVTGRVLAMMVEDLTHNQLHSAIPDILTVVRILDKLMRILHEPDAFGESPWEDIAGYAILKVKEKEDEKT